MAQIAHKVSNTLHPSLHSQHGPKPQSQTGFLYLSFGSISLRIVLVECYQCIFIGLSDGCCCFCQVKCAQTMPTTHEIVLTPCSLITGLSFTCAFGATGFSTVTLRRSPHASLNMKLFDWKKRAAFDHIVIPPSMLRLFVAHLTVQ